MGSRSGCKERSLIEQFEQALTAYKSRQWQRAIALFQEVLQNFPADRPSRLHIQRCEEYHKYSPPDDWDGVYDMTSK